MSQLTSPAARRLLCQFRDTGRPVAVIYVGADAQAHYRAGRVVAMNGSRFILAYQDPAGLARRASFDLANPEDVLAVEPVR